MRAVEVKKTHERLWTDENSVFVRRGLQYERGTFY